MSASLLVPYATTRPARAQSGTQSVVIASSMKELPLKAWGPYARGHLGPACAVDQVLGQQFVFPLVFAQEQQAVMPVPTVGADGKTTARLRPVMLMRRAMGLAPVQGQADDRAASGPNALLNRRAAIVDANAGGLLWTYRAHFAPAALAQANATLRPSTADVTSAAAAATPTLGAAWGAGEVTVDCFPAFADPDGDGLLLRVSLANTSTAEQTYCVDLLGGMDTPNPAFSGEGLSVRAAADQSGVTVSHAKSPAMFALAGPGAPLRTRAYRVSDAYFAVGGAAERLNVVGAALPNGLLTPATPIANADANADDGKRPRARGRGRKGGTDDAAQSAASPVPPAAEPAGEAQYALTRVDSITVAPGQTTTFFLSVGVGRDADLARASAQALLGAAGDPNGTGTTGAYALALKARDAARYRSGLPALDRLMTQTLANTPNSAGRRIGVATRQTRPDYTGGLYDPARDSLMALAWINYRPDFAAAQLNAWFQTKNDAEPEDIAPRNLRATPPVGLFALWELYERTHDRALLARYYPYARRRYLELLRAGRIKEGDWRFSWPATARDAVFVPGSVLPASIAAVGAVPARTEPAVAAPAVLASPTIPLVAAPDYAAYVIRAARILQTMSELNGEDANVTRRYAVDALETARALNTVNWDVEHKTYIPVASDATADKPGQAVRADATADKPGQPARADTLAGLLPLMAGMGALPPAQRTALLETLTDPEQFWSPNGLRSVSLHSRLYRANEGANGAVRYGLNWLLWKALLDLGETDTARKLADNLLGGYARAQAASDACPEWLNGDTGGAGGATDYAGDAGALLAMQAAYHRAGTFTSGWNAHFLDNGYDAAKDTLHLVVRRLDPANKVVVLCVMGRPGGKYLLSGAMTGTQTADTGGALTLTLPADNTTLVIDIAPAG